jgi:hypothetical protein
MFDGTLAQAAAEYLVTALLPLNAVWLFFWPARHALLTVVLVLLYVTSPVAAAGEDDPYIF